MKIFRNNVGIEMTLEELVNLLEDEDRIYDITELIATLEDDEMLREDEARLALEEAEADEDDEEEVHPYDSLGGVAVLERPTTTINQFFIGTDSLGILDEDYLDELTELESDELAKVRRIIQRFGSLLD
jgi:hypothetical protein